MKAGYGNGHLCFSFSFSSQHRVCHLWAFDGLQDVIRLHSEAQMEWDANRRDSTNSQIWKIQCSQGTESFALFGPCSDVLRPGSKTELLWAAAGMQWNSGRAEEETGLPTKSAARLWVQWVSQWSQCTCFRLSDLVIFGKPQASAEAFLCHAVRSVPQILGASWHILTSVERGWWLVSVTISSNGTRVWQAWGKKLWVEYFGQTQMLMIFDNGDDNMTMVGTTLVVVAVMFCKVTVYSTTAVIVICWVEKTWNDQNPLQPIRSQHVGDCAELHWNIFLSSVYLYEPCLCSSPRLHPSSRTIFSTSGTWHHFHKLVRPSAIFAYVQSDVPNMRLYNCIQLCVPRCEISALILFFVLFQQSRSGTFQSWRCMTFHGIFESNRFQSPGSLHFHGGLGQWVAVSVSAAARAIAAVPLIPKRFVTGRKCLWQTCNILWDFLQDLQIGSQIQKLDLDLHYVVSWSEEVSWIVAGPPANLPHDLCLVDLVDRRGEHISIRGMKIYHEFPFHCSCEHWNI